MPDRGTFEIKVEKLVYGGQGLGRHAGQVVLAPFVLPGETVKVAMESESRGLVRANLVEVLAPAAERIAAGCPYFGRCGGCHYQHAGYELQLAAKRIILMETLRQIGKIEPPEHIEVEASEPWGYRNRSQFHIRGKKFGYLEARSHRICPIDHCPISSPRVNQIIGALREMMRDRRWPRFLQSLEVFTNESQVQLNVRESARPVARRFFEWAAERIPGADATVLEYRAGDFLYRVSNRSFFQVNRFLMDRLVDLALEGNRGETALDLYAGVGLFSLPLAKQFQRVTAVEAGASAAADLRFNTDCGGLAIKVVQESTGTYLSRLEKAPDLILADPPRVGLGPQVVRRLTELQPPNITIVACDPATLARDLAGLLAAGYSIARLVMIDLFPQTFHFESIVQLKR